MRIYPVPVQSESEERVIGGYLTLRQFAYIALGVALGGGISFGALFFISIYIRLFIMVLFIISGLLLAFVVVDDVGLDKYLWHWFLWQKSKKEYFWEGRF
ncbi:MAG: PrgI family protein [Peptococcaceae bacterium MAG4]|nr:PrgI family protein [Peptococcaceae bacterium MAG4]